MKLGAGIDLIEIERIERALERRPALAERIFSPLELKAAYSRSRPARHLAARFAAKEAALKALGLGGLRLHEVEVEGGGDTQPTLRLHGSAARAAAERDVTLGLSLTHSRELAAAVVVARGSGS
ncbi:MAG: holo-ACP synthase [Actinomycetota bacterium]|nr:holo-ACP synthase [Actinomycetota bacterium]